MQELSTRGIGVGTIIAPVNHISSIENSSSPWTVVSIDWRKINWVTDNARVFKIILMSNPSIQRELTLEQIMNQSESYYHRWTVISKCASLDIPDGCNKSEFDMIFMELETTASWLKSEFYKEGEENDV